MILCRWTMYGVVEKQHTAFSVNVSGTACVYGDISLPVHGVHTIGMFRYHTALTKMGPELGKIHEKLPDIRRSALLTPENAMLWMDVVYHSIRYVQGVTQVTTTAENAAELGMGVCQDYAHIFLALFKALEKLSNRRFAIVRLFADGPAVQRHNIMTAGDGFPTD